VSSIRITIIIIQKFIYYIVENLSINFIVIKVCKLFIAKFAVI